MYEDEYKKYEIKLYTDENNDSNENTENFQFYINDNAVNIEYIVNNDIQYVTSNSADGFDEKSTIAMKNVEKVYDYYNNQLDRKGYDDHNSNMYIASNDKISESTNGKNAYSYFGSLLSFGYQEDYNCIDLFAHEYTHSVEQTISRMNYEGESGAIMEAYSDIFGELVEGYYNNDNPDWVHNPNDANRSIKDPISTKYPAEYNGKYWGNTSDLSGNNDFGNVHKNSTVISHAAYLMWNGNNEGDEYKIDSKSLAKLWYITLFNLKSNSTFKQLANAILLSAQSMQKSGELTSNQVYCVTKAFSSVGIDIGNISITTMNGAVLNATNYYGRKLNSYYLRIENENSELVSDGSYTSSNPYIVDIDDFGVYTFYFKYSEDSTQEWSTNVRVFTQRRDNTVLNIYTLLLPDESSNNDKPFGNVVSYDNSLYYWKYNSNSFSKEESNFAAFGYNVNASNQLICQDSSGNEKVVLTTNGFDNIAIANDTIYYQVANDTYDLSIMCCSLNGENPQKINDGLIYGITENSEYVIAGKHYEKGIYSIRVSDNKYRQVSDNGYFKACYKNEILYSINSESSKLINQSITLHSLSMDSNEDKEIISLKPSELDSFKASVDNPDPYNNNDLNNVAVGIVCPFVKDDNFYFMFEHIAGSGSVVQSCLEVVVNLNDYTSNKYKLQVSEANSSGVVYSSITDDDYRKYIVNYDGEEVLDKNDYKDFSSLNLMKFGSEGSGVVKPYYSETIGEKQYVLLTYSDFSSWNGWRQEYIYKKCALYEKDLSTSNVKKIYDSSN